MRELSIRNPRIRDLRIRDLGHGRAFVIGVPYLWFIMLALIPLLIVLKIACQKCSKLQCLV